MLNPACVKFTGFYHSIYPNLAVKSGLKTRMFCAPCDLEDNFDRRNFFERFTARGRPSGMRPSFRPRRLRAEALTRNNRKKRIVPCSVASQTAGLLRRQMRSSISIPILNIHKLSPAPAGEAYVAAHAKMIVLQCFQTAVKQGWAEWKINAYGQMEVHVQSGEVFLLLENAVTRIK
jgi:hypothetical protein